MSTRLLYFQTPLLVYEHRTIRLSGDAFCFLLGHMGKAKARFNQDIRVFHESYFVIWWEMAKKKHIFCLSLYQNNVVALMYVIALSHRLLNGTIRWFFWVVCSNRAPISRKRREADVLRCANDLLILEERQSDQFAQTECLLPIDPWPLRVRGEVGGKLLER